MKKTIFTLAAAAAVVASCGTQKSVSELSAINGEWKIVEVEGNKINDGDSENVPFIGFNVKDNQVFGNTGCNLLTGVLKADKNGNIDFSQTGSTRMMCADMKTERIVLDALNKAQKFTVESAGKMTLNDNSGNVVIKLEKRK